MNDQIEKRPEGLQTVGEAIAKQCSVVFAMSYGKVLTKRHQNPDGSYGAVVPVDYVAPVGLWSDARGIIHPKSDRNLFKHIEVFGMVVRADLIPSDDKRYEPAALIPA